MRIAILDYGAGNLHSLAKALAMHGDDVSIEADPRAAIAGDALVLPGVGAFAPAMARLAPARDAMRGALLGGLPCLGVCLGMQLLFDSSDEGAGAGLGVVPGRVERLHAERVPQMGWNRVAPVSCADRLCPRPLHGYFANSYVCRPSDRSVVIAETRHENDRFAAIVRAVRTVGVQFHPEKSGSPGVALIRDWLGEVRARPEGAR